MRYALLALGAVIGTVAVILWRSKRLQMSDQWIAEQHRWATDRSAQWEGPSSAWPWDPHGDNEAA